MKIVVASWEQEGIEKCDEECATSTDNVDHPFCHDLQQGRKSQYPSKRLVLIADILEVVILNSSVEDVDRSRDHHHHHLANTLCLGVPDFEGPQALALVLSRLLDVF